MRILVISAHCGDYCARAGGTIAKHVRAGAEVRVVVLSYGERSESAGLYAEGRKPSLEEVKDVRRNDAIRAAGGIALVHCHGRMGPVLEGFVRMHADALHPIEPPPMGDVTMAEAKRRVGNDLCIVGNVQEHDIWTMPNTQFRALVEETVRAGMVGGRLILSPTATPFGWPTMPDLPRENWIAMLDVALETGQY